MPLLTKLVNAFFARRRKEIDFFMEHPLQVQQRQLRWLLDRAANTVFGREHGFAALHTAEEYAASVPVADYDTFQSYIARTRAGEQNVLWPTEIKWFAKSSGTTSSKSKFIPVSDEGLQGDTCRDLGMCFVCLPTSIRRVMFSRGRR